MPWVTRGLRHGVVTAHWPRKADTYFDGWEGVVVPTPQPDHVPPGAADPVAAACPTRAISVLGDHLRVDQGLCIGCGRCIQMRPDLFCWQKGSDVARLERKALIVPRVDETADELGALRLALTERVRTLGRSAHIRHVDVGSDGTEEWEIAALLNPVYDIHRLGIFFTASPRHADILLLTGMGANGMHSPVRRTLEAMPAPVVVVAVGTDACSGGLLSDSYAGSAGVGSLVGVDVWVPGSPPPPFAILHGLLLALGRVPERAAEQAGADAEERR